MLGVARVGDVGRQLGAGRVKSEAVVAGFACVHVPMGRESAPSAYGLWQERVVRMAAAVVVGEVKSVGVAEVADGRLMAQLPHNCFSL